MLVRVREIELRILLIVLPPEVFPLKKHLGVEPIAVLASSFADATRARRGLTEGHHRGSDFLRSVAYLPRS